MTRETWYERVGWIWFAGLSASVLPLVLLAYLNPSAALQTWARFGYDLPASVASNPAALDYVEFISHWAVTGTIGLDVFGLVIAVTAFRRGDRWAWLAFWFWPVMFATHFIAYESAFRYAQLVWLALSVLALVVTYRKSWAQQRSSASPSRRAFRRTPLPECRAARVRARPRRFRSAG